MRFGSVCSGIEAASVAWGSLGWQAAWLSEIEPFPCAVLAHHYPDVPNHGDMTSLPDRILSGEVEAPDIFCGGTPCFTAGHVVLTASGYRPIESLAPGDEVMTHKGRLRKILRVGSKIAPVGRLSAVGLPDGIVCTEDHPFLSSFWRNQNTKRGGRYAKAETCSEPEWIAAKDLPGRQWCALSHVDSTTCTPDSRLFDERTAMYVAGMYLGDGWTRGWSDKKKKAVILGINEAKYQKLLAVIGKTAHNISHERTGIKVSFGDTAFARWLEDNFSCLSHLKTIPAWVIGHPHGDALLQGYMDTDGFAKKGKLTISTASQSLAYGVCDLLNTQGWSASVAKVETPDTCIIDGRTVNQRDYFQVRANHMSISRKSRVRHGYLMRKVQAWTPVGKETVFNIEVEDDNSFILNGAVVHNCQAFSVAGKRQSLDDARGNLSLIFCEIANATDTVRQSSGREPCVIFWENVPGVLNTRDNAFGCFLGEMAGEDCALVPPGGKWPNAGCVFGPKRAIAWRVLDAQYFGVAQRRRRVFVVASARDGFDPAAILFEFDGMRRDTPPSRETGQGFAADVAPSLTASGRGVERIGDTRGQDPVIAMAHGQGGAEIASERSPTLTCNHEAPIVAFSCKDYGADAGPVSPTLRAMEHGESHANACGQVAIAFDARQDPVSSDRVFGALGSSSPQAQAVAFVQNSRDEVRFMGGDGQIVGALAAETGAKQQCYVAQAVAIRTANTGANGHGISPEVSHTLDRANGQAVAVSLRGRDGGATAELGDEVGNCLRASSGGGDKPYVLAPAIALQTDATPKASEELAFTLKLPSASGGGQPAACMTPHMAVRRLTPTECERLQGFPDGYTAIPWRKKPAEICPDGPRYKALGNSWAVPVVRWIGQRMASHLKGDLCRHS